MGSRSLTQGAIPLNKSLDFSSPIVGDMPATSQLSVGEDRKTVSINADPEVMYIERRSALDDEVFSDSNGVVVSFTDREIYYLTSSSCFQINYLWLEEYF